MNRITRKRRTEPARAKSPRQQAVPAYYDFFAGAGLVRLGLGDKWRCVWANDIDPKKAEVYGSNFSGHFVVGDVAEADPMALPGPVHMAWASFPCQDLSLAGWRKGMSASRSGAFWAFWRIMDALRTHGRLPPLIVIENVVGLLYGDNFSGLCEALAAIGMQFGALVMDAALFVPQSRPRVFVIAVSEQLDCSAFHGPGIPGENLWVTPALKKAAARLPSHASKSWRWWVVPSPSTRQVQLADLIDTEPGGWVGWNAESETQRLLDMMTDVNRLKVHRAQASGSRQVGALYKRIRSGVQRAEVRFDGLSGCLRTPHGGSSRQTIVEVSQGEVKTRLITPRECARLMGAPDTFVLPSRYNDAYRAMGDGVAAPVVAWLSDQLLMPLARLCQEQGLMAAGRPPMNTRSNPLRRRCVARTVAWENGRRLFSSR